MRAPSLAWIAASMVLVAAGLTATPATAVQTAQSVIVSPSPVATTPQVLDGQVRAIIQIGSTVYVGGTFTKIRRPGGSTLARNYMFAYDAGTGAISGSFVPKLDRDVQGLAPGPSGSIFAVGRFNTVNGSNQRKIVRLRTSDGQVTPGFKANADGLGQDVKYRSGRLYVSGKFFTINGTARSGMARLNPDTGAVEPGFNVAFTSPQRGTLGVPHFDITPDGSKLVAMGNFSRVGGLARSQLAVLDLTPTGASVSTWQTNLTPVYQSNGTTTWCAPGFDTWMRDVDISPDGSYFVLVTTGAKRANRLCDTASRWELSRTGGGQEPTWVDWTGGDTFWAVAITGTAIYVGGHFRWMNNPFGRDSAGPGSVPREGIAALDPLNGLPLSWNPGRARGIGTFDLVGTPSGLLVGSDTDILGGQYRPKLGMFPLAGGPTFPGVHPPTFPGDLYAVSTSSGAVTRRSYDLSTLGAAQTVSISGLTGSNVRGAFALDGKLYTGMSDGRIYVRGYDGTTAGAAAQVPYAQIDVQPPAGYTIPGTTTRQPAWGAQIRNITGMFYDRGRIYFTVAGENRLYYRYFTPQSLTIGADLFVAATGGSVAWNDVRGMTMASGKLLVGTTANQLLSVGWDGAKVVGSPTTIASGGWSSRALFVLPRTGGGSARTVFTDDFAAGGFGRWTSVTGLTIDGPHGSPAPSARMATNEQSAWAAVDLGETLTKICAASSVNVQAKAANQTLDLFRLRSVGNGPIARVFVAVDGRPGIRSDHSGAQQLGPAALAPGWHRFELCGTAGTGTHAWALTVDGTAVVNAFSADTGPNPVGRFQIGDTAARTATANWDNVQVRVPA
jgi:hypothetical protein